MKKREQTYGTESKMYNETAKLIIYGDLDKDSILYNLGEIFRRFESGEVS